MKFKSILYKETGVVQKEAVKNEIPEFFIDLNLDQAINAFIYGKEEYDLKSFFYSPLHTADEIIYRQEIMKNLEDHSVFGHIQFFAESMQIVRYQLSESQKTSYQYEKERLFLDAVQIYCQAVESLYKNLIQANVKSQGLIAYCEYLKNYLQSEKFISLYDATKKLLADLSTIKYCIRTKALTVEVRYFNNEADYSTEVDDTFKKFQEETVKDYKVKIPRYAQMNHVEAAMLEGVAKLFPEIFKSLLGFYARHANFRDETIVQFDREIQFYVSYLKYISLLKQTGLKFCYPEIATSGKDVYNYDGFDIVLASKLIKEKSTIVCNDFFLKGKERIIIVSGPNQGGKTTFARAFSQLHYLAALGCPVPGREAKLFLSNKIFTHFEKEENIKNLRSKLEDDLFRIHNILENATTNSIIIMNEILSSTTLQDSVFLSKKIMQKITELDCLCVWVTFIDELISASDKTVSMVSTVNPENPALRTFKVIRKAADGLAYAISIAEKYKVTYDVLKKRIQP